MFKNRNKTMCPGLVGSIGCGDASISDNDRCVDCPHKNKVLEIKNGEYVYKERG